MGNLRLSRNWPKIGTITVLSAIVLIPCYTLAQVTLDRTLGNENSTVNQMDAINERIDGGAKRGGNLFHSFQEFNINEGRGVYFTNPQGVMNIFSRVTGGNASQIFGKLGVLGESNLFFLNPYGIIFGPNSSLDIRGSFVGSTANGIRFGEEGYFSATDVAGSSLLSINPGVLIFNQLAQQPATLINQGNLAVGKDLSLSAGNLDLQGQLFAGGHLILEALNTVQIRDSLTNPFVAYAGGQLLVQGNQFIDIYALNHPQSGLFSGGDLILRSANPVGGDAHYWSGGHFRVEKLDGSLGGLYSPNDPIIRANGDVSLDSYQGASLHIVAGGSVTIPGAVTITEVDSAENSIAQTVTLSNGTTVVIDGSVEPILDIRAGTLAVGSPFVDTGTATSADISVGSIEVYDAINGNGGQVFLTNQYQPNTALPSIDGITVGAIDTRDVFGGGSVIIDARSGINLTGVLNASALNLSNSSNVTSYSGNGGNVTFLAKGDIVLSVGSSIRSNGLLGGNILLNSNEGISITEGRIASNTYTEVANTTGGDIDITAKTISLTDGAIVITNTYGRGNAGAIKFTASDTISLSGEESQEFGNGIFSQVGPTAEGNSGGIEIITGSLSLNDGAIIDASTLGKGNAGAIKITASDIIFVTGDSSIVSQVSPDAEGNSTGIEITTGFLFLDDGGVISTTTFGRGNAGTIKITASDTISLAGENSQGYPSGIFSQISLDAERDSAGIEITAGSLFLTDGATVNASTYGKGNAGVIKITASDTISLAGESSQGYPSGILSIVESPAEGNAGGIKITAGSLSLNDGAVVNASTYGKGNAGVIRIIASDTISLAGESSQEFVSSIGSEVGDSAAEGNAGGIEIITGSLYLTDHTGISASTRGKGNAGAIKITASNTISLEGDYSKGFSGIVSQVSPDAEGNSGDIEINTGSLFLDDGAIIDASTLGKGNAGAIKITASNVLSLAGDDSQGSSSRIFSAVSFTAEGNSGGIEITTGSLFLNDGTFVSASTFGTGNAGAVKITASDTISAVGKNSQGDVGGIYSQVQSTGEGNAGGIEITAGSLFLADGATISAETLGTGKAGNIIITVNTLESTNASQILTSTQTSFNAGNITLNIQNTLQSNDSIISTAATTSSGGSIKISAGDIRLLGNSDIRTNVASGTGGGGDITLTVDSIIAFNDSDILAFAQDGIGGNITLNTPVFFGNGYQTTNKNQNPDTLNNNERVDINASGAVSGVISVPDLTFIQNSLFELPETLINTENLLANSCVVPNQQKAGTFILTGPDGLPIRPNTTITSPYPTGTVETIPTPSNSPSQPKIVEPQGFYRLPTGQIVLSKKCL